MTTRERIRIAFALIILFVLIVVAAYAVSGAEPSPTPPVPFSFSDEDAAKMSWDEAQSTLKHVREIVTETLAVTAKQKDQLADAATSTTAALKASTSALVRLDEYDRQFQEMTSERDTWKENALKAQTEIAKKDSTIFKLQAALAGIVVLIMAYVGLRLFTRLPIP